MPIKFGNDTTSTTEPTLELLGITPEQAIEFAAQRFGVAPEQIVEAASALPDMGNTAQQIMQAAYNLSKDRVKVVKPDNKAAEAAPFDNRVTAEAYKAGAITKPERTWGQVASDMGLGIQQGVNMGAEAVVGAANALVGFESPIEAAKRREKWNTQAESGKSAGLLVQNQKAEDDSKYLSGRFQSVGVPTEIADALATTGAILNNPTKLSDVAAQGVGSIAVSLPLTATTGALGASAIMGGGAAANEAVDRIIKDDAAMAQLSDVYQQAFMETGSQDKALEVTARKVQLPALVVGGALSALATKVTGGGKVEQDLLAGKMTAAKIPVSMLREGGEEALQSPSEQVGANVAIMDNIDRSQTYMEGTGKAFGEGLIGGMAAGGAMGAAGAASSRATQAKTKLTEEITKLKVQRDEKLAKAQAAAALPAVGQASAGVDQMLGIQTANQLAQADSQLQGMMQDLGMIEQIERAQVMPQDPELKALAAQGVPVVEVTPNQPQPYPIQQALDRAIDTQKQVEIEAAYRKRDAKLERQKELDYVEAQLQALDEEHKKLRILQSTTPVSNNALRDRLSNAIKEVEAKQAAQEVVRQDIMATGNPRLVEAGIEEMQGVEVPELPMAITPELAESYAPKLPENFADERLLDEAYRVVLGEVFDNTTKGGGVTLNPVAGTGYTGGDGNEYGQQMTRTKSINHPITQALIADGYTAEEVKAALDASLKGQKLGKRWQGLVTKALDYSNTDATDIRASMAEFEQAKAAEVAPDALGYGGATNAPFAPDNAQPVTLNDQTQPRGADDGIKYSFAGRKAKTANLDNLANAEARIAAGEDAEVVRQETGWHQGVDGKWRFEIDDSEAEVLPVIDTGVTHKLSDVLKHDALFEAYPALQNMFVSKGNKTYITGNHIRIADVSNYAKNIQAQEDAIYREAELLQEQGKLTAEKEAEFEQLLNELDKSSRTDQIVFDKSSLMHEIQHAIQEEENFARGGSSSTLSLEQRQAAINEIEQEAMNMGLPSYERKLNDYVSGKITEDEYNDYLWDVASATKEYGMVGYKFELYQRLAGETEARNTQTRLTMDAQARKLTAPSATQDVPNDKQIVRFDGGRAEMAVSQAQFGRTGNKPNDFITADGSIDFWIVPEFTNNKTAAEYPSKPVRLKVGAQYGNHNGFGEKHIAEQRKKFLNDIGMSAERYVHSLLNSAYRIYAEGNGVLQVEAYGEPKGKVVVELRDEGDYYSVVTAYDTPKKHGSLIWSGRRPVVSFEQNAVSSKVRNSNESSPPLVGSLEKPSPLNGTQGVVNQDPALDALGANRNKQNTTTTNLTKQQATDIISRDADGKRLLKNGKVQVLGSIDEAPAHVLEQAKRSEVASDTIMVDGVERPTRNSNGQLIHPTKQGIENFWRWFGDSQVVDADGKPLVVYHGTGAVTDFNEFDGRRAYYFSKSKDVANSYAKQSGKDNFILWRDAAERVMPVYLRIENSFDVDAKHKKYDPNIVEGNIDKAKYEKSESGNRYDGMIVKNIIDDYEQRGKASDVFLVFQPTKIKSAIGNNGDFDPENKNILYSQDGNIQGFFDPATDTTYLVADALTADTIQGVLVHEVGVHAWWASANSDKKAALEKRAMQLLNQGKHGNEKIKAFYAAVEQRMIDADVQGNAEEAAAYIVEEAINQAGAERYALSDSRLIDAVAKVSKSLANWMSDFIAAIKASFNRIGWLNTANLTGADLVAIAKRNMREVAQNDVGDNVGILAGNVAGSYAGVLASMASDTPTQAEIAQAQRDLDTQLAIADKLEAEYGYLPAPNGEKSNLNRLQWAQVRTPQFKAWFGDWENDAANASKVIDANGEPMVVYHGTGADFDAFDNKKTGANDRGLWGRGHYSSAFVDSANSYALRQGDGARIIPSYVSIKNPLVLTTGSDRVTRLPDGRNYRELVGQNLDGAKIKEIALEGGHDGVIQILPNGAIGDLVAFNPNQIKSAIGNVGTFSGKTGKINFSRTGTTQPASSLIAPRETFKDRLIVDYVDDMNRVKQLQDMVNEKVGADSSQVYDAAMRYRAITPSRLLDMQRSVERIIQGAAKDGVTSDVLGLYMYAVHAPERNAYLFERDGVENGSGMTDDAAKNIVDQLEQEYAGIDKHAQAFRGLLDAVMTMRVINGTVSQAQADEWKAKMPNYVPLKSSIEDGAEFEANTGITQLQGFAGMGTGTKFNLTGKEIKRANGRVSQAGHILENAMFDMQKGIIRAEKNNVLVEFARTVARHRDAVMNGKALWDVYGKKPDNMTNVVEYMVDGRRGYIRINDQSMHEAFAKMDGDAFTWVDSAVQFIKKTITAWNPAFTIVNAARDTQTALLNGSQELGVKGAAKMAAYVPSAMTASWRYERGSNNEARSEWDKWHERYRLAGGKTGFLDVRPIEKIQRDINNLFRINNKAVTWKDYALKTGNAMGQVVKVVEDMGGATENMWRLAAFRVAVEQGKSVKEAARIAKNLTVNFDRRGKHRQTLEKVFLFYNAAIQGTVRMKQSMVAKGALAITGGLMAAGFLAASQDWEDEEGNNLFDLLPEHEKMRGIPITIAGDGKRIVIPMAYGFGYFVYMGMKLRQMQRYVETDGMQGVSIEKGLSDLFNGVALHFNPFGGQQFAEAIKGENDQLIGLLTPVITDPFIQIATNKNAFGGSLYPENAYNPNDRPDSEKAFEYQKSSIYYDIAHTLSRATGGDGVTSGSVMGIETEFSPATLEALVRAFTGGAGQFVEKTLTLATRAASDEMDMVEPANVPVGSVVYKKGQDKLYYDAYQELVKDVQKAANDLKRYNKGDSDTGDVPMEVEAKWQLRLTDDAKQAKKALDEIRDEEKALNKEYRAADDKDTRSALRAEIERLKAQKVQIQSEFIRRGKEERAAGDN